MPVDEARRELETARYVMPDVVDEVETACLRSSVAYAMPCLIASETVLILTLPSLKSA